MPTGNSTFQALAAKKADLLAQKSALRTEYEQKVQAIDDEVAQIDSAIATIEKAIEPYRCSRCKGSGELRVPDAAGQTESRTCPDCKGTGIRVTGR